MFEPVNLGINRWRKGLRDALRVKYIDSGSNSDSDAEKNDQFSV